MRVSKHTKTILGLATKIVCAVLLVFVFTTEAISADTSSITATVTAQNIAVSVSDGTVSFGVLSASTSAGTNGSDTQTATNDGNATADLNISGTDSGDWTLSSSTGEDLYNLSFCTSSCSSPPTNYTALSLSNQTLASGLAASGTQDFDLYITAPESGVTTTQSIEVIIQAVSQ